MTTRTVTTDIMPGLSAEVRVVQEIDIEGKPHLIVCTREWPEPAIYGLRDAGQVKEIGQNISTERKSGHGK